MRPKRKIDAEIDCKNSLKLAQEEGGPSAEGEGDDEGGVMNGDDTRTRKSNVKNLLLSLPFVCRNGPMLVYVNQMERE